MPRSRCRWTWGPDRSAAELSEQTSKSELILMAHRDLHSGARLAALELLCLAGLLAGVAGCGAREPVRATASVVESISGGLDTDVLRIATTWPRPEQEQLEQEFRDQTSGPVPVRLVWVELSRNAAGQFRHSCSTGRRSAWRTAHRVRPSFPGRAARATERPGRAVLVRRPAAANRAERRVFPGARTDRLRRSTRGPANNDLGRRAIVEEFVASRLCPAGPAFFPFVPSSRLAERLGCGRREPWRGRASLRVAALSGSPSEGDLDPSVVPWNEGAAILRGNWHAPQARGFSAFWPIITEPRRAGKLPISTPR